MRTILLKILYATCLYRYYTDYNIILGSYPHLRTTLIYQDRRGNMKIGVVDVGGGLRDVYAIGNFDYWLG